jgi:CxxC motif-containing protein
MNDETNITCILCPIGCEIRVDKKKLNIIDGAKCNKGIEYSTTEISNPKRILTTSILVINGHLPLVSVKTSKPIPKEKIFKIIEIIKLRSVKAPIKIGQVIIKNILDTGSDIIATKSIEKYNHNLV